MIEQLSTDKIYYRQLVEFLYHARKFTRHSVIDLSTAYAAWLANWQPDSSFWDGGALHASMPAIMHDLVVKYCLVEEIGTGGRFERLEQQREGRILRADLHVLSWQIFTVTEAGHQFIERELARGDLGKCLHDGRVQWWRLSTDQVPTNDDEKAVVDQSNSQQPANDSEKELVEYQSGQRPWELIPDNGYDRIMVELWCKGYKAAEIARRIGKQHQPRTIYNRLSKLRQDCPDAAIPRHEDRFRSVNKREDW